MTSTTTYRARLGRNTQVHVIRIGARFGDPLKARCGTGIRSTPVRTDDPVSCKRCLALPEAK